MKEKIQAFMAKRQAKGKRSYEIDMCNGPLLGKILRFAVPLMLSGVLQLFFNAADIVVVGRFTGHTALAAGGSTLSICSSTCSSAFPSAQTCLWRAITAHRMQSS